MGKICVLHLQSPCNSYMKDKNNGPYNFSFLAAAFICMQEMNGRNKT